MDTDALAATLRQIEATGDLDRVKIIYCVSYFQNPMGVSLSLPRRRRLAELAQRFSRRHRIVVLEDAAYKELGFTDEVPPPIKSFDPRNEFVAFTSTFCKPFSAGLKTGYGVLPPELMTAVLRQKGNHDFGSANLPQWIISTAIARGDFDRHLQVVRAGYARKKNILAEAIRTHFPPQTRWIDPAGGLYIWAELPAAIPTGPHSEFFRRALERQVLYVPGEHCFFPAAGVEPPSSAMRLSYGVCDDTHIAEGGQRLGRLACEMLAEAKVGSGLSQ
jgi:2-aminoadipate transaminase